MTYEEFNITKPVLKAIEEKDYTLHTTNQEKAIRVAFEKKDTLCCAQTGTAKFASFTIRYIQH